MQIAVCTGGAIVQVKRKSSEGCVSSLPQGLCDTRVSIAVSLRSAVFETAMGCASPAWTGN